MIENKSCCVSHSLRPRLPRDIVAWVVDVSVSGIAASGWVTGALFLWVLSGFVPEPKTQTLNTQTLRPKPQSPNPQAQTRSLKPQSPKPYNPKHQIPKPTTPNPKPKPRSLCQVITGGAPLAVASALDSLQVGFLYVLMYPCHALGH